LKWGDSLFAAWKSEALELAALAQPKPASSKELGAVEESLS
jgi:hypothetical protein